MSPLNYLWLCSIEHFMIVLPFNYVGWEGSYCPLFFFEADSSLRLVAWGRDVLKWDSEGFEFWWTRIIFEFTIGVVLKVHIPAPVRSWGVLEFILGIWNSNYIAWKITQAYECEWHTFFVQRFRVLVSSSQVQGNCLNQVVIPSHSSTIQWPCSALRW